MFTPVSDLKSVSKGEEIIVHYGYAYSDVPEWHRESSFINSQLDQGKAGDRLEPDRQLLRDTIFSEAIIPAVVDSPNAVINNLLKKYHILHFREMYNIRSIVVTFV